jgi:hypothetical protein
MGRPSPVTDRALRYRANQAMPEDAPEVCVFCGEDGAVEVGHLDGHEENSEPENLAYTCRSCNVKCGNTLRSYGAGRLTHQFNPAGARSIGQYKNAVNAMLGRDRGMSIRGAVETLQGTPHRKRAEYARKMNGRGAGKNPGADSLGEYMAAVADHRPGAHDRGGKVIHETPKSRRSKFAREIARIKKDRYGSGGGVPDWVTNPASSVAGARAAFKDFHGFDSTGRVIVTRVQHEHEHVAAIGELIELWIVPPGKETPEGKKDRCEVLKDFDGAWLTRTPAKDRPQMFVDGGDQHLDDATLEMFGIDPQETHELEVLGTGVAVVYFTDKTHLGSEGGQAEYKHPFGEMRDEDDELVFTGKASRPTILYDTVNHQLYIAGGKYTIPPEGISN